MSRLRFKISMSLDGFVAGPSQSLDNPLGIAGLRLHHWAFPLRVWRSMQGLEGGEVNESTPVVEESIANIGAKIMGRHPVFVLTHHAREPLQMEGGTTFIFITDGTEAALAAARGAADGKDVFLGSGERLFEGVGDLRGLELVRTVATPGVTHLKFTRR